MAVLDIIIAPDETLKQKSLKVEKIDDSTRKILADMLDTMYQAGGIGLAAVQVGILQKLIVIDTQWRDKDPDSRKPLKMINADIIEASENDSSYNEGCLSFPDQYSDVIRPEQVKIRYLDENGEKQELLADGLLATCIQHEIDHTNGITFVEHISRLKRDLIINKLKKAKKRVDFDTHVHGEHCNH